MDQLPPKPKREPRKTKKKVESEPMAPLDPPRFKSVASLFSFPICLLVNCLLLPALDTTGTKRRNTLLCLFSPRARHKKTWTSPSKVNTYVGSRMSTFYFFVKQLSAHIPHASVTCHVGQCHSCKSLMGYLLSKLSWVEYVFVNSYVSTST